MGLQTTWLTSRSLLVDKLAESAFASTTVAAIPIVAATHLSITNVSAHGHGNMAPALTEPLSQTNKLSSSATSASPRPSLNNLISESESASANAESISNLHSNHHNNSLTNSQPSPLSESLSFGVASNKSNQDNFLTSNNKNGSFQSAFEKFQQIRQLQNSNSVNLPPRGKRRSCSNINKLSLGRRQGNTVTSPVNGRLSNGQMGPMCDTNIKFEENINIENNKIENEQEDDDIEDQSNPEKKQRLGDQQEADVQTTQHMDFSNCDELIQNSSQDDVPTLQQSNNNNNKELQEQQQDHQIQILEQHVVKASDNRCEEQQTVEINQDSIQTTDVNRSDCDNLNQQLQIVDEGKTQKTPPRTPPSSSELEESNPPPPIQTTPISSLTPQSNTPSGMGLQKDFIKDTAEMEQVLGELGTSDMDLLQVLKGFDTTPGSEGGFCELSLFTDVDVMNYEEVGMQQPKDAETKEVRTEIERRQMQMQRKCDFLLRRLRKIQTRYMGKHTSEEVAGLFEWQANPSLRRKEPVATRSMPSYEDDKRHQISTNAMRSFLQRIEVAAKDQHVKRNKVGRPSNARLQAESGGVPSKASIASVVPPINQKMADEIAHVSGHLHTELKEIQIVLDSDATASSSGGESADELQQFNNTVQQPLSISKRAAWRWFRDRAAIASRWTWLLAQISDLEYRIRQHTELHHQIKKNKGAVTFEKSPNELSTPTPSTSPILPSSVNGYRGILPGNSKAFDTDSPTSSTGGGIAPNGAYDSTANNSMGSCRTRAFQRAGFRKRKLLQTANVHTVSKKAARPSTVKCGCQWPLHPCGLCTGRPDPTAPRDLPDTMTPSERVALLDSGFHPVLSFPEDVSHSIHFEATMRLPDWQNRVIRCSSKTSPSQSSLKGAVQKAAEREDRSKKYVDGRRKYNRKYPQDIMAANKLKNAKARRSLHGNDPYNNHFVKTKHRKQLGSTSSLGGASKGCGTSLGVAGLGSNNGGGGLSSGASSTAGSDSMGLVDGFDVSNGQLPRSKNASPTPGSHSSSSFKSERMDRRNRNSYDIDNIVIPYSVAAATRVEILPYKEIPTPKWRIIDESSEFVKSPSESKENESTLDPTLTSTSSAEKTDSDTSGEKGASNTNELASKPSEATDTSSRLEDSISDNEEDENEDVSDETFLIRHERALIEERKKFQTYLKYPWSTRSRANRRTDSRAESSGANTPDPSSPAPNTPSVGGEESVPSPTAPSTPQTPLDALDENVSASQGTITTPNNQTLFNTSISAAKRVERKRTASGRKEREHSKDDALGNVTPDGKEITPPYEPLEFPLADDVYETMLQLMPNDHQLLEDCLKSNICDGSSEKTFLSDGGGIGVGGGDGGKHCTTEPGLYAPGIGGVGLGGHHVTVVGSKGNSYETDILAFGSRDNLMGGESDTDSAESGMPDEDPNDPEWREPE